MMDDLLPQLAAGVEALGLQSIVPPEKQLQCLAYLALLQKWNKVYNLTAVRDPQEMLVLHLLDSLSVLPYIQSGNLLDVGSGGGLPGITVRPDADITTVREINLFLHINSHHLRRR